MRGFRLPHAGNDAVKNMKHTYNAYQDQTFEIVYTMSRPYPALADIPGAAIREHS